MIRRGGCHDIAGRGARARVYLSNALELQEKWDEGLACTGPQRYGGHALVRVGFSLDGRTVCSPTRSAQKVRAPELLCHRVAELPLQLCIAHKGGIDRPAGHSPATSAPVRHRLIAHGPSARRLPRVPPPPQMCAWRAVCLCDTPLWPSTASHVRHRSQPSLTSRCPHSDTTQSRSNC